MAKRMTAKKKAAEEAAASGSGGNVDADQFKKALDEVMRAKANASEYAGFAGHAAKQAIEKYGLDRTGFGFITKIKKMEETKRQSAIKSAVRYALLAGFFDQLDAFDEFAEVLEEILETIRENRNEARPAGDETLGALVN